MYVTPLQKQGAIDILYLHPKPWLVCLSSFIKISGNLQKCGRVSSDIICKVFEEAELASIVDRVRN